MKKIVFFPGFGPDEREAWAKEWRLQGCPTIGLATGSPRPAGEPWRYAGSQVLTVADESLGALVRAWAWQSPEGQLEDRQERAFYAQMLDLEYPHFRGLTTQHRWNDEQGRWEFDYFIPVSRRIVDPDDPMWTKDFWTGDKDGQRK